MTVKIPVPEVEDWYTEDMQTAILKAIPEHDRYIYDFLFLTGCRVNEACALQRSDIDLHRGKVIIRNTVKRDGSIGIVKNKKPRRLPYQGEIRDCIAAAFRLKGIGNDFVFVNKWGRRYSDDYLRDKFYKACEKAKVKRIKLKNATRHSFGMGLLRKGYDIWQTSKIMNHSDTRVTEHYVKMLDAEIDGAYGRGNNDGSMRVVRE